MIITIKNLSKITKANKDKVKQIQSAITAGLYEGLRQYEGYVTVKMLSGRPGLRRQSGTAANALNVKTYRREGYFIGNLTVDKRAWYLKVHQHYDFNGHIYPKTKKCLAFKVNDKWVMTKHVYVKKRLYMLERFKTIGKSKIRSRVLMHLDKIKD
jgi:hypothetical protein